jgi:dephospho-CoA kinase
VLSLRLPKKIAVTGGIASGKSTVCHLFEDLGAYYVSADEIVHQLLQPTTAIGKEIIDLLGIEIVVGRSLSREKIAQKVFNDPQLLRELEQRIHPEVQRIIDTKYKALSPKIPVFIAEVPLLFEAGLENCYDLIIVVVSDEEICRKRYCNNDEYRRRSQRLIPTQEKIKKADLVIENKGSLENLRQNIQHIFNSLL